MEQDFEKFSDEQLADMGKFRDDTGRVFDALYTDENGRPAKDESGRLYDLMPSIGEYCPALPEENDWSDIKVYEVKTGYLDLQSRLILST